MKNKISGILVCTIMIVATVLPVVATEIKIKNPYLFRPNVDWEATYGGDLIDWGNSIQQTSDGGFIISGTYLRNAWSLWYSHFYLIKIDSNGNQEWTQIYGQYDSEHVGKSIQQTSDGGYIIAGFEGVANRYNAVLQKTDTNGNIEWSCTFGNPSVYDLAQSVQQTSDGGYIVAGWTQTFGIGGACDAWLIKINANGEEEWNQTFGGTDVDVGNCVQQTTDGGFIIAGETDSFGIEGDVYLIKTDSLGNEEWSQTFGGDRWDGGHCVQQTTDGGYIISGWHEIEFGNFDIYLIKTDSQGNKEWSQFFGGSKSDEGYSVQQTKDGGYFITGYFTDPIKLDPDVYLIKTDASGKEEWSQILDKDDTEDIGYSGIQTSDGGYIITGYTGFYKEENLDVWVIKIGAKNQGPNKPEINGPTSLRPNEEGTYTISAIDPNKNRVYFYVDWGDGDIIEWDGPYDSGQNVYYKHTWDKGKVTIKVKAKDNFGSMSDWSEIVVNIPRGRISNFNIYSVFYDQFPILLHILGQLNTLNFYKCKYS